MRVCVEDDYGAFNASSPTPIKLSYLIESIERTVGSEANLAEEKTDSAFSPYGVESDWYMSIDKLKSVGVSPKEISSWLPGLLARL